MISAVIGGAPVVTVNPHSGGLLDKTGASPQTVTVVVRRNGELSAAINPEAVEWIFPRWSTVGDAYHVRLTATGDAPDAGDTVGSWLALTSNRSWSITTDGAGTSVSGSWTVAISNDGGSTTLDSGVMTVYAEHEVS